MTGSTPFYRVPDNCQVPDLASKWHQIFGRRSEGFFVEVGAYDGENFSNSSCLSDAGWAGLYIEPIAEFAEKCGARHAGNPGVKVLNCAASDVAGTAEIFIGDTLTTLVGEQVADYETIDWAKGLHKGQSRQIVTERLDQILEREDVPCGFDLLVVDVEGAEEKVIDGFDIPRWRPKVLLIELEDEHPDFRTIERVVTAVTRVRTKIEAAGYKLFFRDHINSMYLRADVMSRVEGLSLPSDAPKVAIGLFTYNRPELLALAVESLRAQSFKSFDLLISDNCSQDPKVKELCVEWAERDPRIMYVRHRENLGATGNMLFTYDTMRAPLFMWAADDDVWDPDFIEKAMTALERDADLGAWMSHLKVIDGEGRIVRDIPNLAYFTSTSSRLRDLWRYIFQPECLGKANLIYSVFRREPLEDAVERARPLFALWGSDMLFVYAFLTRARIKIEAEPSFSKRLAPREEFFRPELPREHIVPWNLARAYYGGTIEMARGTPYHLFTACAVTLRYLFDVLYWRLRLKKEAPLLPPVAS